MQALLAFQKNSTAKKNSNFWGQNSKNQLQSHGFQDSIAFSTFANNLREARRKNAIFGAFWNKISTTYSILVKKILHKQFEITKKLLLRKCRNQGEKASFFRAAKMRQVYQRPQRARLRLPEVRWILTLNQLDITTKFLTKFNQSRAFRYLIECGVLQTRNQLYLSTKFFNSIADIVLVNNAVNASGCKGVVVKLNTNLSQNHKVLKASGLNSLKMLQSSIFST